MMREKRSRKKQSYWHQILFIDICTVCVLLVRLNVSWWFRLQSQLRSYDGSFSPHSCLARHQVLRQRRRLTQTERRQSDRPSLTDIRLLTEAYTKTSLPPPTRVHTHTHNTYMYTKKHACIQTLSRALPPPPQPPTARIIPSPSRRPPARRQFLKVRVVNAYCVSHWHHFRLQLSTRLQSAQLLLFHSLVSLHFGVERKWQWKKCDWLVWVAGWLVGWLVVWTLLTPICLQRGSGGDRIERPGGVWGGVGARERETISYTSLSPPDWLLHYVGQQWQPFSCFH